MAEEENFEECQNIPPSEEDNSKDIQDEQPKVLKTEEEIGIIKEQILKLKAEANSNFQMAEFLIALNQYTQIIQLAEEINFTEQLAILHFNKGTCFKQLNDEVKAIEHFTKCLSYDSKYKKALLSRMLLYKKREEYIEASEGIISDI